jgi:hypothetical protein
MQRCRDSAALAQRLQLLPLEVPGFALFRKVVLYVCVYSDCPLLSMA